MKIAVFGSLLLAMARAVIPEPPTISSDETSALVINPEQGPIARVSFGTPGSIISLGATADGDFTVQNPDGTAPFRLSANGDLYVSQLTTAGMSADELLLGGVPQWKLILTDGFAPESPVAEGTEQRYESIRTQKKWTSDNVFTCAGFSILSTDKDTQTVGKTYENLPPHNMIRLQAVVHFVDDWQGATAYLKVDKNFVWAESVEAATLGGSNICLSDRFPEARFSVPIDITLPHTANQLAMTFGTTNEVGSEARFGVSSVSISIRSEPGRNPPKPQAQPVKAPTTN